MKAVVDTNVLISALLKDGTPERALIKLITATEWQWVVSNEILQEYFGVMARPKFGFSDHLLQSWQELLKQSVIIIEVTTTIDFPRDRKDAKFLACMIAANADLLLTGDSDFSEAQALVRGNIVTPQRWLELNQQLEQE
ncbi:MAG: putative toxin-antitoxin system toxin component, PIN family [Gammaproteobacteria bacterium]|nr:putative toxin-antitoxin system toxin component, PIN family [Gammaproteobacteria bacterium]